MKGTGRRADMRLFLKDQRGATAVEYGLVLALVFLAVVSGVTALSESVRERWNDVAARASSI